MTRDLPATDTNESGENLHVNCDPAPCFQILKHRTHVLLSSVPSTSTCTYTVFFREMETVVPDDHKDVLLFLYILLPGSNSINVSDFCPHSRQIRIDRTRAELRTY